jgi:hypothetical protein
MRRGLVPSLGAGGSLVAAAVVGVLLLSGVVAFRGWPGAGAAHASAGAALAPARAVAATDQAPRLRHPLALIAKARPAPVARRRTSAALPHVPNAAPAHTRATPRAAAHAAPAPRHRPAPPARTAPPPAPAPAPGHATTPAATPTSRPAPERPLIPVPTPAPTPVTPPPVVVPQRPVTTVVDTVQRAVPRVPVVDATLDRTAATVDDVVDGATGTVEPVLPAR